MRCIEGANFWCGLHSKLNDPMEGTHRFSALLKEITKNSKEGSLSNAKREIDKVGVASFSEIKNHETMWAHYAGNFNGICISYRTSYLLSGLDEDIDLIKMNYSEEAPMLVHNNASAHDRARLALSHKSSRWSPEREWRIVTPKAGTADYKNIKCVTAVYIGSRTSQKDTDEIIARMRELGISTYSMKVDSYTMRFTANTGITLKISPRRKKS
ncbi:DUF2971 domain-containing protein [Pseudomonas sp. GX19020]|uniref:DUF2971 domain-containing protein n=1 Tax=Pseudomonas sp. GX19020 TaxID=2942277 RepID=UPI002018D01F|nr:DUF2971 domain-containing protein [Pseudomonas sp. GX19020]MCL4068958.1 DUF2971 domain-containing protein [Pseudomonas sp. GX19020]